jgi:membrane protease YdiL (CAAX protease family)
VKAPPGASSTGDPGEAALRALPAAASVWVVVFLWRPANFWVLMTLGVGALAWWALRVRGPFVLEEGIRPGDALLGVASSAALYAVFVLGRSAALAVFPPAASQIGAVYALGAHGPAWAVAPALALVIGPGEEVFWRGLVQWGLVHRLGPLRGWAAATLVYGLVHLAAGNALLVVAALAAGAFWGGLYLWCGRLAPVVVSHVLWDLTVFLLLPLR